MGVSVYYTCERATVLTEQEQEKVKAIIDDYDERFELKEIAETFCVYDYDDKNPNVIFEGSTKLPLTGELEDTLNALFHWLAALTEIRRAVDAGKWHVHLDDTDAQWDEQTGWQMPM